MRPAPGLCGAGSGEVCAVFTAKPRDFLLVATPGAGKTAFALRIAGELLADRTIEAITVVVPTEHLKVQWAQAAAADGIALDPKFSNPPHNRRSTTAWSSPTHRSPPPDTSPGAHRGQTDAGHLRRDPPRRGRQDLG